MRQEPQQKRWQRQEIYKTASLDSREPISHTRYFYIGRLYFQALIQSRQQSETRKTKIVPAGRITMLFTVGGGLAWLLELEVLGVMVALVVLLWPAGWDHGFVACPD